MSKNTETTEVTVIDNSGNALPAFLQPTAGTGSGLQGLDPKDFIVPRIKLLQGQSQEVKDNLPGAVAGALWLTVMDQPLEAPLEFTVVNNRVRVLLLAPRDDGQGILARADDGRTWDKLGDWNVKIKNIRNPVKWTITDRDVEKSGLLNFGTSVPDDPQSNPAATKFYDFLVYLPAYNTLAVLSLARSQAKKAKELISKITMAQVHMNGLKIVGSIGPETANGETYFNYKFRLNGYVDEATFNLVQAYARQFAFFRMDESDLEDTGAATRTAAEDRSGGEY